MREIVIDTETTGLNFRSGDRIIEVGCVELINHVSTSNTLQFYCKTDKEISESAKKVSGISNEFLKDKKTFEENHQELLSFIKNDVLIIHNSDFDMGFLNNELSIIGKPPLKNKVIDTVSLARKVLNTRVANLDYLCRRFNIDLSERKLHGALLDSRLLAEVYLELRGGKQFSMDLNQKELKKDSNKKTKLNSPSKTTKLQPTPEDIRLHKEMIKDIKDAFWNKNLY
tara:strand:- start:93 stop:773 length:681 start_codon:yes stop_codon:yes gene_type:complete